MTRDLLTFVHVDVSNLTERQMAIITVALASPPPDLVAEHPIGYRVTCPGNPALARRVWRRAALTYVRECQARNCRETAV